LSNFVIIDDPLSHITSCNFALLLYTHCAQSCLH